MKAFENLIVQVGEHQKEAGELVTTEDVMSLFRPLVPDPSISIATKLKALTLLEQVPVYYFSVISISISIETKA